MVTSLQMVSSWLTDGLHLEAGDGRLQSTGGLLEVLGVKEAHAHMLPWVFLCGILRLCEYVHKKGLQIGSLRCID